MSWEKIEIGEICDVISGYAFKSKDFTKEKNIPVVKIKNIKNGYTEVSDEYFVKSEFLTKINSKFHLKKGDILISLTGSHITLPNSAVGRIAKYQYDFISFLNQRAGKIIPKDDKQVFQAFLFYFLSTYEVRFKLAQFGRGGANQCNISPSNVKSVLIDLPPLPTQKKIASILSAYDDLIENNLKRIQLLEETAQRIYKEWFVNFKFPNHENTFINKETGLPEGWKELSFKDSLEFKTGKLNSNAAIENGKYPFFTCSQEVFRTGTYAFDTEAVLLGGNNASANYPLKYFKGKFDAYQRTYVIRPKCDISHVYVYLVLLGKLNYLKQISTGAATKFLTLRILNQLKILVPKNDINSNFSNLIEPFFKQISLLDVQNQSLKEARDLLLPRLMNRTLEI
jgi:type I restriction enzyme S subunit